MNAAPVAAPRVLPHLPLPLSPFRCVFGGRHELNLVQAAAASVARMEGMLIDCVSEIRRDLANVSAGNHPLAPLVSLCALHVALLQASKLLSRSCRRARFATIAASTNA